MIRRPGRQTWGPVGYNKANSTNLAGIDDEDNADFQTLPTIGGGGNAPGQKNNLNQMTGSMTGAMPGSFGGPRTFDNSSGQGSGHTTQIPGISGKSLSYLPGDVVDNAYQLIQLIGRGGMGAVFACRHLTLNQEYALKLLSGQEMTSEAWTRFQSEAKALARLNHPGIISIYNMGIDKSQCPYYIMDLLRGEALHQTIAREGQLPYDRALDIFIQVADALSSAHSQGIIHRDIKPSNLMLETDPKSGAVKVKLVDFGIARLTTKGAEGQSQTATGLVFGTPYYMSPEQCDGQRVDERSDIYSLGCALFETLTGTPPFVGASTVETLMMHSSKAAPTLKSRSRKQEYPEALETALQKLLSKKPSDRYQSMSQLKHDLERIKSGKQILAQGLSAVSAIGSSGMSGSTGSYTAPAKRESHRREEEKDNSAASKLPATAASTTTKILMVTGLMMVIGAGAAISMFLNNHPPKSQAPQTVKGPKQKSADDITSRTNLESDGVRYATEDELNSGTATSILVPASELRTLGASETEIKAIDSTVIAPLQRECSVAKRRLEKHFQDSTWAKSPFKKNGVFQFPDDLNLGAIQIGNKAPVDACGPVAAPPNERACLYLITTSKPFLHLLDKFGPEDLNGIALVFDASDIAIDKLSKWTKLDDVWFFNPLLKALPANSDWEESDLDDQYLYKLDQLKNLKSLGLSKPVSGAGIVSRVSLLGRLECLRLKQLYRPEALYSQLPYMKKMKELWLSDMETSDAELDYFVAMPHLERLTIKRSHLTFKSSEYFTRMRHLKYLCLDRNDWSQKQRDQLKKMLPKCQIVFDTVVDSKHWNTLPRKHG